MSLAALEKAIRVLNTFKDDAELGITEISQRLGLHKSNVHNILSTYESMGYVEKNKQSQKYRLSFGVLELSHALLNRIGVRNAAYPHMKELAGLTGENVYLAIPYGTNALYLDAASPTQHTYERSLSGETAPLYCTGIGKAMLAYMPPGRLAQHVPETFVAHTANTLITLESLTKDLAETRRRGYAIDDMEHEYGIKCVAVPVLDEMGMPIAALSISGPSLRFDMKSIPRYADKLRSLIERIETVLLSLLVQYR